MVYSKCSAKCAHEPTRVRGNEMVILKTMILKEIRRDNTNKVPEKNNQAQVI